jgi:hypothetical protein
MFCHYEIQQITISNAALFEGHGFAPGLVGTYQDSEGGDGCTRPSPPFSIYQTRRLLTDVSAVLAWTIELIASSKSATHSFLSLGSNFWMLSRMQTDPRFSRALSRCRVVPSIDVLLKAAPLTGCVKPNDRRNNQSPTDFRPHISRFHRSERLHGTRSSQTIGRARFSRSIFLPKNSRICPKTPPESGVIGPAEAKDPDPYRQKFESHRVWTQQSASTMEFSTAEACAAMENMICQSIVQPKVANLTLRMWCACDSENGQCPDQKSLPPEIKEPCGSELKQIQTNIHNRMMSLKLGPPGAEPNKGNYTILRGFPPD